MYAEHYVQEDTLRSMYLSIVQQHFSSCFSVSDAAGPEKLAEITEESF